MSPGPSQIILFGHRACTRSAIERAGISTLNSSQSASFTIGISMHDSASLIDSHKAGRACISPKTVSCVNGAACEVTPVSGTKQLCPITLLNPAVRKLRAVRVPHHVPNTGFRSGTKLGIGWRGAVII